MKYRPLRALLSLTLPALLVFTLVACSSTGEAGLAPTVVEDIPEGANRVVLEREGVTEMLTPDAPAQALYNDTVELLRLKGFTLASANDDALTILTEPMMVDGLALRMDITVQTIAGGSQLVARTEYAPAGMAGNYTTAAWTEGNAKQAFARAFDMLEGITYSDIKVATE